MLNDNARLAGADAIRSPCGGPPAAGSFRAFRTPRVRKIKLVDFRSYEALDLAVDSALIVVNGENGAGKTNLIEALSMFSQGRGLRRANWTDCGRRAGSGGFSIAAVLDDAGYGERRLGVGLDPSGAKIRRIDGAPASSARAFDEFLRLTWLTPAMDSLFNGPAGDRRRFIDRLTLAVDCEHGARASAYERALRNRNRLLEMNARAAWLDAAEREAAELATAVCLARQETVARLNALIAATRDDNSPFPYAELALTGAFETATQGLSALEAEDWLRQKFWDFRARDAAAGRALMGPQTSDFTVRHGPKDIEAHRCSTGEQKALLTGLTIAHARLATAMSGLAPIILLDEIGAHFDSRRRAALFDALEALGGQAWLTGADSLLFQPLMGRAQFINVLPGRADLATP